MQGGSAVKRIDPWAKRCVMRHASTRKRSYNAVEKAIETKTRRQGKRLANSPKEW